VATGYSLILTLAGSEIRGTTLGARQLISILIGGGLIPVLTAFNIELLLGSTRLFVLYA
jgi:hypothetical protein